jgi:hypothetical protein
MTWNSLIHLEGSNYSLLGVLVPHLYIKLVNLTNKCEILPVLSDSGSRFELGTSRIPA